MEISHHILIDSPEMAWEVCQFQSPTYAIVSASMLLMDHSSRSYWWIFFETFWHDLKKHRHLEDIFFRWNFLPSINGFGSF